jgi:hypothetical protein
MQAIRVIKQPLNHQVTVDLPPDFDQAKRVEVIVLGLDEPADQLAAQPRSGAPRRRPSPRLAGTQIKGDLMAPTLPDADWNALA